jgi:hypothetical protein
MAEEIEDILKDFITGIIIELKNNAGNGDVADGIDMSISTFDKGKFTGALGFVEAPIALMALETGRAPTGKGFAPQKNGSQTLQQAIYQWVQSNSIQAKIEENRKQMTQEQLSWAMAIKIHKYGTKLFSESPEGYKKSGVVSNVINDDRLAEFMKVFRSKASLIFAKQVLASI